LSQLPQGWKSPEVLQQAHAAAVGGFGQRQQGIELAAQHGLEFFLGPAFVDHAALVDHVLRP
jgi:alkanesulfonate monooxygenase SsuD/methylene tetrahydromethanopterin reductase-like flavin-dependent oxidoreductase (luciferase family)